MQNIDDELEEVGEYDIDAENEEALLAPSSYDNGDGNEYGYDDVTGGDDVLIIDEDPELDAEINETAEFPETSSPHRMQSNTNNYQHQFNRSSHEVDQSALEESSYAEETEGDGSHQAAAESEEDDKGEGEERDRFKSERNTMTVDVANTRQKNSNIPDSLDNIVTTETNSPQRGNYRNNNNRNNFNNNWRGNQGRGGRGGRGGIRPQQWSQPTRPQNRPSFQQQQQRGAPQFSSYSPARGGGGGGQPRFDRPEPANKIHINPHFRGNVRPQHTQPRLVWDTDTRPNLAGPSNMPIGQNLGPQHGHMAQQQQQQQQPMFIRQMPDTPNYPPPNQAPFYQEPYAGPSNSSQWSAPEQVAFNTPHRPTFPQPQQVSPWIEGCQPITNDSEQFHPNINDHNRYQQARNIPDNFSQIRNQPEHYQPQRNDVNVFQPPVRNDDRYQVQRIEAERFVQRIENDRYQPPPQNSNFQHQQHHLQHQNLPNQQQNIMPGPQMMHPPFQNNMPLHNQNMPILRHSTPKMHPQQPLQISPQNQQFASHPQQYQQHPNIQQQNPTFPPPQPFNQERQHQMPQQQFQFQHQPQHQQQQPRFQLKQEMRVRPLVSPSNPFGNSMPRADQSGRSPMMNRIKRPLETFANAKTESAPQFYNSQKRPKRMPDLTNLHEVERVDTIPEIKQEEIEDEDDETRAYRLKIEEQKRQRQALVELKERRRRQAALQKQLQPESGSSVVPGGHTSESSEPVQGSAIATIVNREPNNPSVAPARQVQKPIAQQSGNPRNPLMPLKRTVIPSPNVTRVIQQRPGVGAPVRPLQVRLNPGNQAAAPGAAANVRMPANQTVSMNRIGGNVPARGGASGRGRGKPIVQGTQQQEEVMRKKIADGLLRGQRMRGTTSVPQQRPAISQTATRGRGNAKTVMLRGANQTAPTTQRIVRPTGPQRVVAMRTVINSPAAAQLPRTKYVSIENLATSTTDQTLLKICESVGVVESFEMVLHEKKANVVFRSPLSAAQFYTKYHRKMFDLSLISVNLHVPLE